MERKNIFELIDENYKVADEIRKINKLFAEKEYFVKTVRSEFRLSPYRENMTFVSVIENYLFDGWKGRGTCIDIDELLKRANARLPHPSIALDEETVINNLEVMLNLVKLYRDNIGVLEGQGIDNYTDFDSIFCNLLKTLKTHMGLSERVFGERLVLYPENPPLEQALNITKDVKAQWELVRYCRENMDLAEKRKSLAFFATNFYIEPDRNDDDITKKIIEKSTNILNNLHIRHNNQTGKWENDYLKDISEADALKLCDLLYNQILTVILLREQLKYGEVYKAFKDRQKGKKS